jgi:hypothetical protein
MVSITYTYFFALLYLSIRIDFVSRVGETDLTSNIGVVEIISKRNKGQAIVMAKGFLCFRFWGCIVKCTGANYEPIVEVKIVRESREVFSLDII